MHREPDGPDHAVAPILAALLASVALLDVAWAAVDLITLAGRSRTLLGGLAAGSGVLLAALALLIRRRPVGRRAAHAVEAAVVLSVGLSGACGLAQTGQPQYGAWVVLAMAGAGVLLLSRRWFLATALALWALSGTASYVAISRSTDGHRTAVFAQLAMAMLAATAFAQLLHHWRVGSLAELDRARQRAADAEVRDSLTGVANNAGLTMLGSQVLEAARRHGDAVHCLVLDVDGLGVVNHELGRLVGDEVLVGVADSLIGATRAGDVVARWGGDEFVVIGAGSGPVRARGRASRPRRHRRVPARVTVGLARPGQRRAGRQGAVGRRHAGVAPRAGAPRDAAAPRAAPGGRPASRTVRSSLDRSEQPPAPAARAPGR